MYLALNPFVSTHTWPISRSREAALRPRVVRGFEGLISADTVPIHTYASKPQPSNNDASSSCPDTKKHRQKPSDHPNESPSVCGQGRYNRTYRVVLSITLAERQERG